MGAGEGLGGLLPPAVPVRAVMVATHVLAGFVAGAGLVKVLDLNAWGAVWVLLGGVLGALLPDIDHPKSWLGRRIPFISLPIAAVFGHRGITHSLVAVAGVAAALYQGLEHWSLDTRWGLLAAGLCAGYASHLVGDFATHGGVPLLWPSKQRYSLPLTFLTGGVFERLLFLGLVLGAAYLLVGHFAPWALEQALALLRDWTVTVCALTAS